MQMLLGTRAEPRASPCLFSHRALPISGTLLRGHPGKQWEGCKGKYGSRAGWGQAAASDSGASGVNAMGACAWKHTSLSPNSFSVAYRRNFLAFLWGCHHSASPPLDAFLSYEIVWGGISNRWSPERWREFALLSNLSLKWNLGFEMTLSKNFPSSDVKGVWILSWRPVVAAW